MQGVSAVNPDSVRRDSRQQRRMLALLTGVDLLATLALLVGGGSTLPADPGDAAMLSLTPVMVGLTAAVIVILYGGMGRFDIILDSSEACEYLWGVGRRILSTRAKR